MPDELEQLKTCLLVRLIVRLTENDGYEVMSEPWPGVATFPLGIHRRGRQRRVLNISICTKISGAGLGGIATAIRCGAGSRLLRAGLAKLDDAKIMLDRWTRDCQERFDAAHTRAR